MKPGSIIWVDLDPVRGREQRGRRPSVVLSSPHHLGIVTTMVIVIPCTTVDRRWINHIELTGPTRLGDRTWAMTEQVRTISRDRIAKQSGIIDPGCLHEISMWVHRWIAVA